MFDFKCNVYHHHYTMWHAILQYEKLNVKFIVDNDLLDSSLWKSNSFTYCHLSTKCHTKENLNENPFTLSKII